MRRLMQQCAVLLGLMICASSLNAQQPVTQSGQVTPGHAVQWLTTGVVGDAGTAAQGNLSSLGITASGPSFCINSDLTTAAGYQQFCFGATTANGASISVQNFGTAPAQGIGLTINGSNTALGLVNLPTTTNDSACFANTTGIMKDCGFPAGNVVGPNTSVIGDIAVWNNTTGTLLKDAGGGTIASAYTWAADQFFKSGRPWADVRGFGAAGNGSTDDTAAVQAAVNSLTSGGIVYIPPGTYCIKTGPITTGVVGLELRGAGDFATALSACGADVSIISLGATGNAVRGAVRDMTVTGSQVLTTTKPAIIVGMNCGECLLANVTVTGGSSTITVAGSDSVLRDVKAFNAYGTAMVYVSTTAWIDRVKFDHNYPRNGCTAPCTAFSAWQANTVYNTLGTIVSTQSFYIQLMATGTSANSAPTLLPYGSTITDNTAQWQLVGPTGYYNLQIDNAPQAHVTGSDFSGYASTGIGITGSSNNTVISDTVVSSQLSNSIFASGTSSGLFLSGIDSDGCIIAGCSSVQIGATFGGKVSIVNSNFQGPPTNAILVQGGDGTTIKNNACNGPANCVSIAANVVGFDVIGNRLIGSTAGVTIAAGTSNHYSVTDNITNGSGTGVVDNGSGTAKCVGANDGTAFTVGCGGTGGTTVPAARVGLAIDQRTTFSNAAYNMVATDYLIVQTGTLSAPRTINLVAASSVNPGRRVVIIDESGTATSTNTISLAPNGTDKIRGSNTTQVAINSGYGSVTLESDGSANWTPVDAALGSPLSVSGIVPMAFGGTNAALTANNGGVVWSNATQLQILAGTATANLPLLSGATGTPAWAAITYPTSATSGGVPYFSSTAAMGSSGLMTLNGVMYGGGAGNPPLSTTQGPANSVLTANAGAPIFSATPTITSLTTTSTAAAASFADNGYLSWNGTGAYLQGNGTTPQFVMGTSGVNRLIVGAGVYIGGTGADPGNNNLQVVGTVAIKGITNVATTSAVCVNTTTGLLTFDGTIGTCTVSDERLKNIGPQITDALAKLLRIKGFYYTWRDPLLGSGEQIGIGAQAVERVFPELVQTDSAGRKSADYQRLVAPIIEAIRELKADNDNLHAELNRRAR